VLPTKLAFNATVDGPPPTRNGVANRDAHQTPALTTTSSTSIISVRRARRDIPKETEVTSGVSADGDDAVWRR
jgi:hypothetical protein